jgi:AcrR family transcriptional regulator
MRKKKPRRRLDAEAARELILDATGRRLVKVGPAGIRLQEVAAEVGVSHPTVLHHFGSRELLVKAVITRSLRAINASLIEAITTFGGDDTKMEGLLESVAAALEKSGHARIVMWLALEGQRIEAVEAHLGEVVDAVHALRLSRTECTPRPTREDTARTIVLATLALFGGALIAPALLENAGLGDGERESPKFRAWLSRLLVDHLQRGG